LRGLNPAALMAQGLGSREGAPARASLPEIPGYELVERLGEGGMGEVFLARQLSLDREVAVKLVRRELLAEEWFLERLEREARLLARLRHPHLVTVHDFLRLPDGTAAVVMELVEGGSLRDRLRAAPAGLPLDEALTLIRQVATALAAAHAEGVVHRDIKPENVLLDAAGQVRVTDFGMALSLAPGAPRLTRTGATLGTPGYLAPEQLTGADTDARTDLFALGVLLYEMLTGRLPLGSFEPPRSVRPEIPAAVETALLRALKPNPADRPHDVAAWLELLAATSVAPPTPAQADPLPASASTSIPRRTLLLGGLLAGLGGGLAWYWLAPRKQTAGGARPDDGGWQTLDWPADLAAATVSGSWRREGDAVISGDGVCLLALAKSLPPAGELRLNFRRLGGSESVALFFRHPAGFGSAEVDGWSRHRSGVQSIDGRTTQGEDGFDFTAVAGQDHELHLELRPDEVRLRVDRGAVRIYPLQGRQLTVVRPWNWSPDASGPALALGSYQSPTRFERLRWRG
jgi:hypothetical protein